MYNTPLITSIGRDHPVTVNEIKRLPVFRFQREMRFFNFLGGLEIIFGTLLVPFIHWIWRIPTVLASSTMISREVESQTWNSLQATPYTLREIIWAKYTAIFHYMDSTLTLMLYLRGGPVVVFLGIWGAATITTLPRTGFADWFVDTIAIVSACFYLMISPTLDVAVDGAMGMLASALSPRRSTALIMATLARMTAWLLPMVVAMLTQYGFAGAFGVEQLNVVELRSVAAVAIFGPGYAFIWNVDPLLSTGLVVGTILLRLAFVRVMLEVAVFRAARLIV